MIREDPPPESPGGRSTEPPSRRVRPRPVDSAMLRAGAQPAERVEGGRLAELFLQHGDGAVRLAYLLTGDRALAEDLAQDAFVRLAGRLVHLRDPGAFDAYLRGTVVNLTHSYFRRKRVEGMYLKRAQATFDPASLQGQDWPAEDREELWRALQ